jgi:hypothetical protein
MPRRTNRTGHAHPLLSGPLLPLLTFLHLAMGLAAHATDAERSNDPVPPPDIAAHPPGPPDDDIGRRFGLCTRRPQQTLLRWSHGTPPAEPAKRDQPLASDRPDFTESSTTVGCGLVQIESGYTFTLDESAGVRTTNHSFPEALVRIGLFADWLEARIAYNYGANDVSLVGVPDEPDAPDGSEDLYLGIKVALTPQEDVLPEMALVPQMTVPSGRRALSAGEVMPGANWLYGWDVLDWLDAGGSTQINRARDDEGQFFAEFAQSLTTGFHVSERLGAYVEWFMFAPIGHTIERTEQYFDGGLTFDVTDDLQLDVRAGAGLNDAADDFFTGVGSAIRF